ncbi:sensor histidine kinase [Phytoactinopolyspora limicola]|uniref:sensor histidine kinase n=1 Tax=Phytoactinopolyspora limicola TaxID=2715536 RepID=UPI00140BEB04|nr:sensor histidine kinase [Phytoactinopolyspora limicola]
MWRPAALSRLPAWVQDGLLAAFIAVMQIQGTHRAAHDSEVAARALSDFGHLGSVLLVVSGLSLVARRRWPVPVFVFTALVSLLYYTLDFPDGPGWLALFVALYSVTAYGDGRRSVRIVAIGITVLAVGWLLAAVDIEPAAAMGWVVFRIGASVMAAALGESVRSRRVIAVEAEQRAELAERTRDEEARRRVDAERLRIAREVHDTVAHSIAIINVQAGVTAHVLDKRPERAREALETIEQTSAQALDEMRVVLGVLRTRDHGRVPSPGLGQIDDLITVAREAGLDVKAETSALPAELPTAVDRAGYRILQESVTNVIRHAGPTRVTITITCADGMLTIRVVDDGRSPDAGPAVGDTEPGKGIVGMRERCELLGGGFTAGPLPEGGFEVEARLPLAPAGVVRP